MATQTSCLNDVPFSELGHFILPFVITEDEGDLPDNIIDSMVRNAAIRFMHESQYVRRTITIDAQCGVDEYPLELGDDYHILSLRRVTVCGEGYDPIHEEDTGNFISPDSYQPLSRHLFSLSDRNWLVLEPVPDRDMEGAIQVYVTVGADPTVCSLPRELYQEYGQAIAHGALAEILLIKTQPWYDARQAVLRANQFQDAINDARLRSAKGHMSGKHKGARRGQRGYRRGFR